MRYLITLDIPNDDRQLLDDPEKTKKEIQELIEKTKPEGLYFSTIRRRNFFVVNLDDPHVEGRKIFEKLSNYGNVTVDPVSTFEEFGAFMASL